MGIAISLLLAPLTLPVDFEGRADSQLGLRALFASLALCAPRSLGRTPHPAPEAQFDPEGLAQNSQEGMSLMEGRSHINAEK